LGQLVPTLETEQNFELHFLDGPIDSQCHPEIKGLNFRGPFHDWFTWSPEQPLASDYESVMGAIEFLYSYLEDEGPFDGILGFSQGATLACGLLLYHASQNPQAPAQALFKFAVFFSAAALAEIKGVRIGATGQATLLGIPSLHVCGRADPMLSESLSLMHLCESGTATLIMHKLGHTIPRDRAAIGLIIDAVEKLQHDALFA
jgi:predicted esterase